MTIHRRRGQLTRILILVALTLLLAAAAAVSNAQQWKVVIVSNVNPSTSPFSGGALRACNDLAAADATVRCSNTIISGFSDVNAMVGAWETMINARDDEIYVACSSTYAAAVAVLSLKFPSKVFVVLDSTINPTEAKNTIGIVFAENEGGFLAGALAGVFTVSKKVGVIGGPPIAPVKRFVHGYLNGVMSVCPTCETYNIFNPSFSNAVLGRAAADSLIARGVDVVFGAGGGQGSAGILHAAGRGAFVIGVDNDESQTTFLNRTEVSNLLSSAIKRTDTAIKTAIDFIRKSQRGGFNLNLDASLDGVGLATFASTSQKNFSTPVSVSIRSAGDSSCAITSFSPRDSIINLIRSSLQRRLINTGVATVTGDLQPLGAPGRKTWVDLAPFGERDAVQANMQGHSAAAISRNRILVWGGQDAFGEFPQGVIMMHFDAFNWTRVADVGSVRPQGRMFHALGYDGASESVFVFGGQTRIVNGDAAAAILGDTWKYSVDGQSWTQVSTNAAGPSARTNVAHAVVGRSMFVFGGVSSEGKVQGDFWRLDMESATWSQVTVPAGGITPPPLQHAALFALNSTALGLFGGARESTQDSSALHIFDLNTNQWRLHRPSSLSSPPPPAAERMRAVTVDARRVLFTGGINPQGALNSTYVWRLDEDRWDQNGYGALPGGLHSHALVAFNQSAYAKACEFPVGTTLQYVCKPQTDMAVVAIGGVSPRPGGGVAVSFATPDPPPPPVGMVDVGAKWAVTVVNVFGLMLAFGLIGFVVMHRGHKVVKAANPPFCIIILIGAALAHVGLIGSGWAEDQRSGMMQSALLLGTGYVLMFSALLTKIYLIYAIFSSQRIVKRRMSRYFAFTFLMTSIQLALSGAWFMFDTTPVASLSIAGVTWIVRRMDANWVVLVSMPLVILTMFGIYFAFKCRNVQSSFNEGQSVAIATYAIALTLLVVGTVVLLLEQPLVQYIISASLVSVTTVSVQLIFFVPKLLAVLSQGDNTEMVPSTATGASGEGGKSSTGGGDGGSSHGTLRCKTCKQAIGGSSVSAATTVGAGPGLGTMTGAGVGGVKNSAVMRTVSEGKHK